MPARALQELARLVAAKPGDEETLVVSVRANQVLFTLGRSCSPAG